MLDDFPNNPLALLGVVFLAILSNGFLFGVLTQQFCSYWISGFKDRGRVKVFVLAQYFFAALQCAMLCYLAWNVFVIDGYDQTTDFKSYAWQGPVGSVCQCVLILMANIFLAHRIYTLTESRPQSGLIIVLSTTAFVFGLCTLIQIWGSNNFAYTHFTTAENVTTVIWHVLQAISEFLISAFLTRALLNSRIGFEKSDNLVYYFTRRVIQLGLFAAIWSLAGMATWFLLPKYTVYAFFDMTAGSIYTHMVFDTLLSRTRLRERIEDVNNLETGLAVQSQLCWYRSEGQESLQIPNCSVSAMAMPHLACSMVNASTLSITKDDTSDFECAPVGQLGVRYEAPYTPHDTPH